MKYSITGGNLPVVTLQLEAGEKVMCEAGGMSWMDRGIEMETKGGGIGKMFGRMFTGESLMMNHYEAKQAGEIAFASSFPGEIRAVEVTPSNPIVVQKRAFLASVGDIQMSVFFQRKLGSGIFGGEGFLMQKLEGHGLVFLEIDGSAHEFELAPGQEKVVNTGYVAMMDASVKMDVEMIKGVKNVVFGGEGLFNTVLTGPGKVTIQSMPIPNLAGVISGYIPTAGK